MRVTEETKSRTRKRLMRCARRLFEKNGFEQATTRDITRAAGIALGTLFNYFPNKEALALAIIGEALEDAKSEFQASLRGSESFEELLFSHVAMGLRHLRPCRPYVVPVLESTLSPLSAAARCDEADQLRLEHLELVQRLLAEKRFDTRVEASFVSLHLYWTLYLGVLAFWAQDESTHQEDTLALLDQSVRLFVAALSTDASKTENDHDAERGRISRSITG